MEPRARGGVDLANINPHIAHSGDDTRVVGVRNLICFRVFILPADIGFSAQGA